ncbi:MAG: replicative DNA helicase [Blastocatellia bacterium]|nr:replicative DNA helicase [Blastocatellia bacterium]
MTRAASGDPFLEKGLPSNVEAERSILGAILLDNAVCNQAVELMRRDEFFLDSHRRIFDKMISLSERGLPIDLITLTDELRRASEFEQIGGATYIASLIDGVPRTDTIEPYAKIVKAKAMLRRLITASNHIIARCFDDEDDPEIIIDEAEQMIFQIAEDRIRQGFQYIGDVAQRRLEQIEQMAGRPEMITGVATGFTDFDQMTSGLQRQDLIIIAARPSQGKCLAYDSEIVLSDGSLTTIEEIYRRRPGEGLLTLNSDWKFTFTRPAGFVDDGLKPVYRVTTRLGRFVRSTITHPFLTLNGWQRLSELKPGDRIAVPRNLEVSGSEMISESEVERLAGSIAKVNLAERSSETASGDPALQKKDEKPALTPGLLTSPLEERSLSNEKTENDGIPPLVFKLIRPQLALFLNRLFAAGCSVDCDAPLVGYASASERLIRQVQHLLLRFDVIASVKSAGEDGWQLEITDFYSLKNFISEIGTLGKSAISYQPSAISYRRSPLTRDKSAIPFILHPSSFILPPTPDPCPTDVYWDEIVSIEYAGCKQVYDLTIAETHNFVANDICVHNTALALNMAQYAAKNGNTIGVFSLEMSAEQLVSRLLCSEARVDAHRLRTGYLNREEWARLADALRRLTETQIYIDDTAGTGVLEMRAKTRRLKAEHGLDLLIIDYMQLMSGRGRTESRQQEVSQISRDLKGLAKELDIPVIALSQLSRAPEMRSDHRPQLSDLRESGCLAGESLITLADTGAQVPIRDMVGRSGFAVWALNEETMQIERALVSRAFSTGVKPVYRLTTRLGRSIRATANHKFRTLQGWKRLDEIRPGDRLAVPREICSPYHQTMSDAELALLGHLIGDGCTLPRHAIQYTTRERDLAEIVASLAREVFGSEIEPRIRQERSWYQVYLSSTRHHTHNVRSAVSEWMSDLGVWGLRSYEKRVPDKVFEQPRSAIALFLRHLWATDGCVRMKPGFYPPAVYYASSSERLARDVQSLLLHLGINAILRRKPQNGKGRDQFSVSLSGKPDLDPFISQVGAVGQYKTEGLRQVAEYIEGRTANTNRDVIPNIVWKEYIIPAMQKSGITTREMTRIRTACRITHLYNQNLSRERAARIAQVVNCEMLNNLAHSHVYWDQIISIEPDGEVEVYDLTVDDLHNFVANCIISHNSIEQDSDVVCFIYREEVYNQTDENRGVAELIIGKQRNGPVGNVQLAFLKEFTRFENMWRE